MRLIDTDKAKRLLLFILIDGLTDDRHNISEKYYSIDRNNAKAFRKWIEDRQQKDKVMTFPKAERWRLRLLMVHYFNKIKLDNLPMLAPQANGIKVVVRRYKIG